MSRRGGAVAAVMTLALGLTAGAGEEAAEVFPERREAEGDAAKAYFLMHDGGEEAPEAGHKLLVVLPGGDGSEAFHPFVKRVYRQALPGGYLAAQLIAVKWTPEQEIVWPHESNRAAGMRFSTEEFVEAVIGDVRKRHAIDGRHIFTLSWSSSGPAAYAVSLGKGTSVTGSYVAMSVFNPKFLPPLAGAEGHAYFIEHSPEDGVCPFWMARKAEQQLTQAGGRVRLSTYEGGHGWAGDVYQRIREGIAWLEAQTEAVERQSGAAPD